LFWTRFEEFVQCFVDKMREDEEKGRVQSSVEQVWQQRVFYNSK
jgi:hypothetical protein